MFAIVNSNGDHNRTTYSEEMRKPKEDTDVNLRRATRAVAHGGIRGGIGCLFVCVCVSLRSWRGDGDDDDRFSNPGALFLVCEVGCCA